MVTKDISNYSLPSLKDGWEFFYCGEHFLILNVEHIFVNTGYCVKLTLLDIKNNKKIKYFARVAHLVRLFEIV